MWISRKKIKGLEYTVERQLALIESYIESNISLRNSNASLRNENILLREKVQSINKKTIERKIKTQ